MVIFVVVVVVVVVLLHPLNLDWKSIRHPPKRPPPKCQGSLTVLKCGSLIIWKSTHLTTCKRLIHHIKNGYIKPLRHKFVNSLCNYKKMNNSWSHQKKMATFQFYRTEPALVFFVETCRVFQASRIHRLLIDPTRSRVLTHREPPPQDRRKNPGAQRRRWKKWQASPRVEKKSQPFFCFASLERT